MIKLDTKLGNETLKTKMGYKYLFSKWRTF